MTDTTNALDAMKAAAAAADEILAPICAASGRYIYDWADCPDMIAELHSEGVTIPAKAFHDLYMATHPDVLEALTAWNTRANADARLVEALREAEWTMRLTHERMAKFAKADVGIHGGACPRYGEQELRNGLAKVRAALSEVSHG